MADSKSKLITNLKFSNLQLFYSSYIYESDLLQVLKLYDRAQLTF